MTITMDRFGKDHWSTFAYVETRIVDYKGVLDRMHLRVDLKRHPGLAHAHNGAEFPTRLRFIDKEKGFEKLESHDDIDCLEDCEAAGLLEHIGTGIHPVYKLTDLGAKVAGELRHWKGQGKNYCDFTPSCVNAPLDAVSLTKPANS